MPYQSVIDTIWSKLSKEGATRRATPSQEKFEEVVSIFRYAEEYRGPTGYTSSLPDIRDYRVEFNVWRYYFGDDHATFPGIGSTLAAPESLISPAQKLMALSTRQNLEKLWADQKDRRSYQPQMGWNTATGEPWMAIRCYAGNAYPAISGPYNSHLKAVGKLIPEFVIMFQRLRKEKCILIWPEFASSVNMSSQDAWERFGKFRAFLEAWASTRMEVTHINDACIKYLQVPYNERPSLPLPVGFKLEYSKLVTGGSGSTSLVVEDGGVEWDCWRPNYGEGTKDLGRGVRGRFSRSRSASPHRHCGVQDIRRERRS